MRKIFGRGFEPHFNDDLYTVSNWNNWDRHTECEIYREYGRRCALEFMALCLVVSVSVASIVFFLGQLYFENIFLTMMFSFGVGISYKAGSDNIIDLYLENLDRHNVMKEDNEQ